MDDELNEATLNEAKETNWRATVVNQNSTKQNPATSAILYHILILYIYNHAQLHLFHALDQR